MTTTTHLRLAAAVLAAIVLAATSGCGGSKGLSQSELIAKADPICQRALSALEGAKLSRENLAQVGGAIATASRQAHGELAKLTPPSSMAADWREIVNSFSMISTGMQKAAEAAKGTDAKALAQSKAFREGETEFLKGQQTRQTLASRNGFQACGKI